MNLWRLFLESARKSIYYLFVLSLVFPFWKATFVSAKESVLDRAVALVNNRPVLISEVNEYLSQLVSGSNSLPMNPNPSLSREKIIQQLIDEELILQEAERKDIQINPKDLERTIEEIKKRNRVDTSQLVLALAKSGVPFKQFCEKLKRELRKTTTIRNEVMDHIIITDAMVEKELEIRKIKEQDQQEIRLKQIFQPFEPDSKKAKKEELRRRMELVLNLLKNKQDFDQLAKRYSKGPNADNGGDMGWIRLDDMAKPLADALMKLEKGETSGLIESSFGLHIIKVVDTKKIKGQSLKEIKDKLREELFKREFQEQYKTWIKGLRDAAHIEIRL